MPLSYKLVRANATTCRGTRGEAWTLSFLFVRRTSFIVISLTRRGPISTGVYDWLDDQWRRHFSKNAPARNDCCETARRFFSLTLVTLVIILCPSTFSFRLESGSLSSLSSLPDQQHSLYFEQPTFVFVLISPRRFILLYDPGLILMHLVPKASL